MAFVRADFVSGTLGGGGNTAPPDVNSGNMTSSGLAALPSVTGGDRASIVLDPFGVNGAPEIVFVSSHAGGTSTATILRGQSNTIPRAHPASEAWVHGPTAEDFANFQAQLDNQFHTSVFTATGQLLSSSAPGVPATLSAGSTFQVVSIIGGVPVYRYTPFPCTSSTRPTVAAGAFAGMLVFETDTLHLLVCTSVAGGVATWAYDGFAPGDMKLVSGSTLEDGWVWADGTHYNGTQAKYLALWNRISIRYGGVGQSDFCVPNLVNRFVYGWDPTNASGAGVSGGRAFVSGATTRTLTTGNLPPHTHSTPSHTHTMVHNHPTVHSSTDGLHHHDYGGGTINPNTGNLVPIKVASGTEKLSSTGNASTISFTVFDNGGSHDHTVDVPNFSGNTGGSGALATDNGPGTSDPINTMPPYIIVGWAVRL